MPPRRPASKMCFIAILIISPISEINLLIVFLLPGLATAWVDIGPIHCERPRRRKNDVGDESDQLCFVNFGSRPGAQRSSLCQGYMFGSSPTTGRS